MAWHGVRPGTKINMLNGLEVKVTAVHDYEPSDRSVGIMTGCLTVTLEDGRDYDILDNGDVTFAADSQVIGHGPEIDYDDYEPPYED